MWSFFQRHAPKMNIVVPTGNAFRKAQFVMDYRTVHVDVMKPKTVQNVMVIYTIQYFHHGLTA